MADEPPKGETAKKIEPPKKQEDFDIFIAQTIYPDPIALFAFQPAALADIKATCTVVLDTNVLLVPYTISPESLDQIKQVYTRLAGEQRLIIPAHVAREFAKNRPQKIAELYQNIARRSNIESPKHVTYPLLAEVAEYQEFVRLEREVDEHIRQYRGAISKLLEHIRGWNWNDPVSMMYREIFTTSTIFDVNIDKEEILKELERRSLYKLPPGYKDSAKDDKGIGDLLIWQTILALGNDHDILFVSGDAKADWWHRSEGQFLYPRYELTEEFRRVSQGKSFHIITFSDFLKLFDVKEAAVREVKQKEQKIDIANIVVCSSHNVDIITSALIEYLTFARTNIQYTRSVLDVLDYLDNQVGLLIIDQEEPDSVTHNVLTIAMHMLPKLKVLILSDENDTNRLLDRLLASTIYIVRKPIVSDDLGAIITRIFS